MVAEVRLDTATGAQSFTITSIAGWSCIGRLSKEQERDTTNSVFQVPLICNNGTSGSSIISLDRFKGSADINFRLANGTVGNAKIG
ncbi:MAG: hypothetical protein EpisKO_41830 [Epibacterium sp.]